MSEHDVTARLIGYLEEHLFGPVLGAQRAGGPEPVDAQHLLAEAQQQLAPVRERLRRARSPAELYPLFHEALARPQIAALEPRLHALGLPALQDLRIDFEQMAQDLGAGNAGSP